ncbi:hypothetical protein AeNC1_019408, partial [Aphanomyces euteiches]
SWKTNGGSVLCAHTIISTIIWPVVFVEQVEVDVQLVDVFTAIDHITSFFSDSTPLITHSDLTRAQRNARLRKQWVRELNDNDDVVWTRQMPSLYNQTAYVIHL